MIDIRGSKDIKFKQLTVDRMKGLIISSTLSGYLRQLKDDFGVVAVKNYTVFSYFKDGEQRYRVFFTRLFSAENGHEYMDSSFLNGRDVPPPGSSQKVDPTDLPMQSALYFRRPFAVRSTSPNNRRGKTTIVMPRFSGDSLTGIYVFHFENKKGAGKENPPDAAKIAEEGIPDDVGMRLIAEQLNRYIKLDDQREIQSILRHEGNAIGQRLVIGLDLMASCLRKDVNNIRGQSQQDIAQKNKALYLQELSFRRNVTAIMEFIQEGTIRLERQEESLENFIRNAMAPFINNNRKSDTITKINITAGSEAQMKVMLDPGAMAQILTNLVSNSEKYRKEEESLEINIQPEIKRDKHGKVTGVIITYDDNGQGIGGGHFKEIFFYGGKGDAKTDAQSSGIGLFVVRILLAMHGGSIEVSSQKGKGTRFVMTIPIFE